MKLFKRFPGFISGEVCYSYEDVLREASPKKAIKNAFKTVGTAMKASVKQYENASRSPSRRKR